MRIIVCLILFVIPRIGLCGSYLAINPEPMNILSAEVHGSIEATFVRLEPKIGAAIAAQVARLLRWKGDIIRDVHPKDNITLAYRFEDGEPRVVALSYNGLTLQMQAFPLLDAQGILRLYNNSAQLIEPQLLHAPTAYQQISEVVQSARGKRRHRGIDLKANTGTPVYTPFAAVVSRINWSTRLNGNCIDLVYTEPPLQRHHALFLHLDSVAAIKPGEKLKAHTQIGTVGNTGRSSAAHLHYEVRDSRGAVQSPLEKHGKRIVQLNGETRALFMKWLPLWRAKLGLSAASAIP